MSSYGSPDPLETPSGRPGPGCIALIAGAGLITVVALAVGWQALGVLLGVLLPPAVPLPPGLQELGHTQPSYGVDEWRYSYNGQACELAAWYEEAGGRCVTREICPGRPGQPRLEQAVICTGEMEFSAFAMRWRAEIIYHGELSVQREIFWTGTLPPLTATPPPAG